MDSRFGLHLSYVHAYKLIQHLSRIEWSNSPIRNDATCKIVVVGDVNAKMYYVKLYDGKL